MKRLLCALIVCGSPLVASAGHAASSSCGPVKIASMNWASAEVMANIDKIILSEGYGCDAQLVPGDTMPSFTSMTEKGEPDVAPEMYVKQFKDQIQTALDENRIEYGAKVLKDGSQEGFWIPQFIADAHPDIVKVSDALKHPELFPAPEDPSKGGFYDCPPGYGCQIMLQNYFKAYDMADKGWTLVPTGSAAGLDGSIAKAFASQKGWIGYYWSPTAIMARYPLKKLEWDVPFDEAEWTNCTTKPDCANPKINAWPVADVYTLLTPKIEKNDPQAAEYLKKRAWSNDVVNKLLAWKDENQATGEDTAFHFLEESPDVWTQWVSPEVAEKVKDAL